MMTSGSWRIAAVIASRNDSVSAPTSRWMIMHFCGSWMNSIGSSIVTMCACRLVDVAHHRGHRGRLAVAGGTGDEDEAAARVGDLGEHRRQVELLEREHLDRD